MKYKVRWTPPTHTHVDDNDYHTHASESIYENDVHTHILTASHSCAHTRDRTHVAPAGKTKRQEPPLPLLLVFVPKAQTLTPE